jgi:hypothetical protein
MAQQDEIVGPWNVDGEQHYAIDDKTHHRRSAWRSPVAKWIMHLRCAGRNREHRMPDQPRRPLTGGDH